MAKAEEYGRMDDLTQGFVTKADKMRVLAQHGYLTADIARFLGVRYQQVRNTLEGDKRTGYSPDLTPQYSADSNPTAAAATGLLRLIEVGDDGFAQIPPDLIEELIEDGRQIFALPVDGGVYLTSLNGLVGRAQATFAV